MAPPPEKSAYRDAGVDIDAQQRALARVQKLARTTFSPQVLSEIGSFGGLFRPALGGFREPVLVASADGVGTKLEVARRVGDLSTVGRDLVNHCVNDVLVQGALPLFFLDYIGAGALDPDGMVSLVEGVVAGCRENGCALLGGETAEMPGFYRPGDYELVGFIVGLVDRPGILDGSRVEPGDVLVGLRSSGLHTNGYSLARKILFDRLGLEVDDPAPWVRDRGAGGRTVGRELLAVHRSYLASLRPVLGHPGLHALAHVTGGGLTDNLPRILPRGTCARIRAGTWEIPEVFLYLQEHGEVDSEEMFRVFNMGLGMIALVTPGALQEVLAALRRVGERAAIVGTVEKGGSGVIYELERRPADGDDGG